MLRRLLIVLVPLLVALFAALGVPLAANIAQRETQAVYLDRLADATRFAALADDALRRGQRGRLRAEISRYDEVYGIAVAVFAAGGDRLESSRPGFDADTPEIRAGLATAFAGHRNEALRAAWPWQRAPMVIVEPVGRDSSVIAAVVTVSPTDRLRSTVLRRWGELAALGVLPFLAAVGIGGQLAWWVLRPVRALDRATVAIAAGRLDARAATVTGPPELRRLAGSFNTMIDTVARTLRRQRTFVADASHQLRNPLASLRLAVDNLTGYVAPAGRELHAVAQAEVEEMGAVVDALLSLTVVEGTALAPTAQPVLPLVDDRLARWRQVAEAAGMTLVVEMPQDGIATYAPAEALGSLLDELVGNACRLSGGSTVTVTVARQGTEVVLSVRDDGVGLSDDERGKAGSRFWRGPAHAEVPGTGLGLAICRELVADWGGRLTLHHVDPRGLDARITLPVAAPAEDDDRAAEGPRGRQILENRK
ncbi:MAG TPA: HAMP domain-containing sensor histidine kinase [Pilimelia sp.]|nr:HAMP domain-containing sensor histidine kinase [Pilimelia sp.]